MASLEVRAGPIGYYDDGTNKGVVGFQAVDPSVEPVSHQSKSFWQPKSIVILPPEDVIIKNQTEYTIDQGAAQTGISATITKDGSVSFNNNNCTLWGQGTSLRMAEIDGEEAKFTDQFMIINVPTGVGKVQYSLNNGQAIELLVKDGIAKCSIVFGNSGDLLDVFITNSLNPEFVKMGTIAITLIHKPLIDREVKIDSAALAPIKILVNGVMAHFEITAGIWNEAIDAISGEAFNALDLPMIYVEKVMA